jgi:hypothetical protein
MFHLAALVFWGTFFANQRGCPSTLIPPLYQQLISNNSYLRDSDEGGLADRKTAFIEIHDTWMKWFQDRITGLCEEWLESPACKAWIDHMVLKRRYYSK